jgi:hypothetical protein
MIRPVGSQDLVFRWLEVSIGAIKKIVPKSCGEIFKLKKLMKLKIKVGKIVSMVIKVEEKHQRSPPYFELQK